MKQKNELNWNSPLLKWETWNEELVTNGEPLKSNCYQFAYRRFPDRDRDGKKCFINTIYGNDKFLTTYIFIPCHTSYGKLEEWEYETWIGSKDDTALNGKVTEFVGKVIQRSSKVTKEDVYKDLYGVYNYVFHAPGECKITTGVIET